MRSACVSVFVDEIGIGTKVVRMLFLQMKKGVGKKNYWAEHEMC